jgi:hypothetical protein
MQPDDAYPAAATGLNRWLPPVTWLLAIPHYIALLFLTLVTDRYPPFRLAP